MSVDLDINNYNLEDILNLFRIPINFDEKRFKTSKTSRFKNSSG